MNIPTLSDIRRALAGAATGAALAVGPERWRVIRAAWRALVWAGWAVLAVYLFVAIMIAAGVLK